MDGSTVSGVVMEGVHYVYTLLVLVYRYRYRKIELSCLITYYIMTRYSYILMMALIMVACVELVGAPR